MSKYVANIDRKYYGTKVSVSKNQAVSKAWYKKKTSFRNVIWLSAHQNQGKNIILVSYNFIVLFNRKFVSVY